MKRFASSLFICFSVIFVSCSAGSSKKTTTGNEAFLNYLSLKERATHISTGTDTTFLQFRFGMTPSEVKERLKVLEKDSTVYYDYSEGEYTYDIMTGRTGSLSKIHCSITTKYNLNQLYSIMLYAKNDLIASTLMVSAIMEKYGSESVKYKHADFPEDTYVWFRNDTEIKVIGTRNGGFIKYTNLKREKEMEEAEQKSSDSAKLKTQTDL